MHNTNKLPFLKRLRKLSVVGITAASLAFVSGCSIGKTQNPEVANEEFTEFLDELVPALINPSDYGVKILFNNPENFNITPEPYQYTLSTKDDYKDSSRTLKDLEKYMEHNFDFDALDDENKINYMVIQQYLKDTAKTNEFYELDQSVLGGSLGIQSGLPFGLAEVTFDNEKDIENYFNMFTTIDSYFMSLVELEKTRQENGTGYSKYEMEDIIKQAKTYATTDDTYLVSEFNKKMDSADFLDSSQKESYKEKNKTLISSDFKSAYANLAQGLEEIEVDSSILGLSSKPDGKKYYEAILQQNTGVDMSISQLQKFLDAKEREILGEVKTLLTKNPDVFDKMDDMTFSNFTNVDDNIVYLHEAMQKDFPAVELAAYQVKYVPEEYKDNFAPAAYYVSKIDPKEDDLQTIIINGEFNQNLFATIAHESYPGHMYQDVYAKSKDHLHPVRQLISYAGFSEGWGKYVETFAYGYAPEGDPAVMELSKLDQLYSGILYMRMDIGIHYEGWTLEQFEEYLNKNYGINDQEIALGEYKNFLESPANSMNYFLNSLLLYDLYNEAKTTIGDNFDPVSYHAAILDLGNCSYSLVEKTIKEYIKENK